MYKNKNLWLVLCGFLVSGIGDSIYFISITYYLLSIDKTGELLGIVLTINSIPALLLGPFAGVIADKYKKKITIVSMDIIRFLLMSFMAILLYYEHLSSFWIYLITLMVAICNITFNPSIAAAIPLIVKDKNLNKANSLLHATINIAIVVGPALGGILFNKLGFIIILILNAISYLISGISEMFLTIRESNNDIEKGINITKVLKETKEGFKIFLNITVIKYVVLFSVFTNFFFIPLFELIIPLSFKTILNYTSDKLGYAMTARAIGTIVGSMILFYLPEIKKKSRLFIGATMAEGILFALFGFTLFEYSINILNHSITYLGYILGLFIIGILMAILNIPVNVLVQRFSPKGKVGTVFAIMSTLFRAIGPLSLFVYSVIVSKIQIGYIVLTSAILIILSCFFILFHPKLYKFRQI
ncbi:MFS transporter [Caloranaerobacter ferrireducens]|uniref:MFS transporter n=1 Tax=Caloranaerobacter ferrireducens TaxID=1323370 RepID=UPI00241C95A4|nr:MFS transporter [Caloranaerobacter ferrireducens]